MKKITNILSYILLFIYVLIVLFVIVFVLNENEYGISQFKNYSYVYINNINKSDNYEMGDLVIVKKVKFESIKENQELFIYKSSDKNVVYVKPFNVKEIDNENKTITLKNVDGVYKDSLILGKRVDKYKKIGQIIEFLTNKNIFLLLIIMPCLFLVVYLFYSIINNLKNEDEEEIKED